MISARGSFAGVLGDHFATVTERAEVRAELRGWAFLAAGSLGLAGVFAMLVALSRVPGITAMLPWTADFFGKGLVIHVVFSFVVWFLTVFALLATIACHDVCGRAAPRLAWLGSAGRAAVALAFPFLFVPAFLKRSGAFLNNYVPVIDHPYYAIGLALLYVGVLLPVIRLFANLPGRRDALNPLAFATIAGGLVYVVALACLGLALAKGWSSQVGYGFYEQLFWGSGHVLHFLNVLLVVGGWYVLGRIAFGAEPLDPTLFRTVVILLTLSVLPAPAFYLAFASDNPKLTVAFVNLQYGLGPPVMIFSGAMLVGALRRRAALGGRLPWREPAFLCLVLSMTLFGIGGLFGFLIDGTDTRTPAHYHGVIAGVNVVLMGLFLRLILPVLDRAPAPESRKVRLQVILFGFGQAVACVGLFWAGGYGAPRKVAAHAGSLADGAIFGMYLNGIGALVAIVGGVMFIWTVLSAVMPGYVRAPSRGLAAST